MVSGNDVVIDFHVRLSGRTVTSPSQKSYELYSPWSGKLTPPQMIDFICGGVLGDRHKKILRCNIKTEFGKRSIGRFFRITIDPLVKTSFSHVPTSTQRQR